jgi:two-component system, chemotaxis family, protein-glutamate methylesterase/glutaminase
VLHIAPGSPSALAHILGRAGKLPCRRAGDGEPLRGGEILVAPLDRHLVVEDGHVRLTAGPRENGRRPAIDVLFRLAAAALDSRVIGVVLSGTRDDGSAGLPVIKPSGGATIVQDPQDAPYAGMPASAIAAVSVDAIVPAALVGSTIAAMVKGERPPPTTGSDNPGPDPVSPDDPPDPPDPPEPVTVVCPDCGGVLTERAEAGVLQWECRVGRRYSPNTLADAQADDVESALWAAIRALEDRAALLERMAHQADQRAQDRSARRFLRQSQAASEQAGTVRRALAGAAGSTLRRVPDTDEDEHIRGPERAGRQEGAA